MMNVSVQVTAAATKALKKGRILSPANVQKLGIRASNTLHSTTQPMATGDIPIFEPRGTVYGNPTTDEFNDAHAAFSHKTNWELLRGWTVLSSCGITPLVKNANQLLALGSKLIGQKNLNRVIKPIFFSHFCGGETPEEVMLRCEKLLQNGVKPIINFSAEASENGAHKTDAYAQAELNFFNVLAQLAAVDKCSPHGISPIKPSSLCNAESLLLLSKSLNENGQGAVGLSLNNELSPNEEEIIAKMNAVNELTDNKLAAFININNGFFKNVFTDLMILEKTSANFSLFKDKHQLNNFLQLASHSFQIGAKAESLGQKILVDAEYFSMQAAIDFIAYHMQKHFNTNGNTRIFNTFQCYLKETDEKLNKFLDLAEKEHFNMGAKLVRGAYMVSEREKALKKGVESPVHDSIQDTHACYNRSGLRMLEAIKNRSSAGADFGVVFATHNKDSIKYVLGMFERLEFTPEEKAKVGFAQLFGMADNLTFVLAKKNVNAMKLLPYGPVELVLPYLLRRAQENNTMLGSARNEKKMMVSELKTRFI